MGAGGGAWAGEIRAQLRLATPVVVIQVGLMAMGFVDSAFMGRVSPVEFAAVSIGNTWSFLFLAFGLGVLTVLDPIVSQAWGARDLPAIARGMQRGLVLALLLSVVVAIGIWPADRILVASRQPPEVVPLATTYARITILSAPAFLGFVALRQALQAMHRLRPLIFAILLANGVNALLDWMMIGGRLGFPALGSEGCAWATVLSRWSMFLVLPLFCGRELSRYLWPVSHGLFDRAALGRMLRVGLPVGLQIVAEFGIFSTVAFLMGGFGTAELSGHQTALHLASAAFMVPLGISMAGSIRVGNEIGRGNPEAVQRAARVALAGGAGVMFVFGTLFLTLPGVLARILTDLDEVLAVAVVLLPLAGLFQVFDGIQVVAAGLLRGMADTRVPMLIHVLGFWGVGLPLGCGLAYGAGLGPEGLWWGLAGALLAVAVAQLARLRVLLARGVGRLVIDARDADGPGGSTVVEEPVA